MNTFHQKQFPHQFYLTLYKLNQQSHLLEYQQDFYHHKRNKFYLIILITINNHFLYIVNDHLNIFQKQDVIDLQILEDLKEDKNKLKHPKNIKEKNNKRNKN